jgi:hypothetical protein
MERAAMTIVLVHALIVPAIAAQQADSKTLATVRIPARVTAAGTPLLPGTYEIRLTQRAPSADPRRAPDQRPCAEFVANGKVVACEIPIILRDDDLPATGASSRRVPSGTRVELLKGGDWLRVSVKREKERYLIYLPVMS